MGGLTSLLLPLAAGALHFLGDQACPQRAETEKALRRIDSAASKANHFALLELQSTGLELRLFDDSGALLERRFLEGRKSCAEWARIAAALLATWESELSAPELTFTDQASTFVPAALGSSERAPNAAPAAVVVAPAAVAVAAHALQLEVGLGAGAAGVGANSFAADGTLLVGLGPRQRPFGVRLALEATTFRSQPVGGGAASWQRTALALGGYGTFGEGEWKLELGAAFLGGVLTARGTGFDFTRSGTVLEPGLEICPRLRWDFARAWSAWAQLGAAIWLKSESVQVLTGSQTSASGQIPTLDASATVGVSFLVDL